LIDKKRTESKGNTKADHHPQLHSQQQA